MLRPASRAGTGSCSGTGRTVAADSSIVRCVGERPRDRGRTACRSRSPRTGGSGWYGSVAVHLVVVPGRSIGVPVDLVDRCRARGSRRREPALHWPLIDRDRRIVDAVADHEGERLGIDPAARRADRSCCSSSSRVATNARGGCRSCLGRPVGGGRVSGARSSFMRERRVPVHLACTLSPPTLDRQPGRLVVHHPPVLVGRPPASACSPEIGA